MGRTAVGERRSLRTACRRLHAAGRLPAGDREARPSRRARRDRRRDHAGRRISADAATGATTACCLMRPIPATAARRTSRRLSTPRMRAASRCCSTSSTIISARKGTISRSMRRTSSPTSFARPGATPSISRRVPSATTSSRTPNIGSRSFTSTGCASTRRMRSRTTASRTSSTRSPSACESRFDRPDPPAARERGQRSPLGSSGRPTARNYYTAQWNDDVHHVLHVAATGERSGYYAAYGATEAPRPRRWREGFAYQGEMMAYRGRPRGAPERASAARRFRRLHPEPRPDRQPRLRRAHRRAGAAGGCARAGQRLSDRAANSDDLHGRGGRGETAFPVLLRLRRRSRRGRAQGAARGIQALSRILRSRRASPRFPIRWTKRHSSSSKLDWEQLRRERAGATIRRCSPRAADGCCRFCRRIKRGGDGRGSRRAGACASPGARARARSCSTPIFRLRRVAFPPAAGDVFWTCGETGDEFGPWSVRWSLSPA